MIQKLKKLAKIFALSLVVAAAAVFLMVAAFNILAWSMITYGIGGFIISGVILFAIFLTGTYLINEL